MHDNNHQRSPEIRVVSFCGVDDSVSPGLLQILSAKYHWIEWGVVFRGPGLQGTPRYATEAWVQELARVNYSNDSKMRLAAHLCHLRCQQVIQGDASFVQELATLGFSRIQINSATGITEYFRYTFIPSSVILKGNCNLFLQLCSNQH